MPEGVNVDYTATFIMLRDAGCRQVAVEIFTNSFGTVKSGSSRGKRHRPQIS